jgi:hypothetical protein
MLDGSKSPVTKAVGDAGDDTGIWIRAVREWILEVRNAFNILSVTFK